MLDLIIFSKDRACQLELLLRSISEFAPNLFNVGVIYKFSNEAFKEGYDKIIKSRKYSITVWDHQDNRKLSDCVRSLCVDLHRTVEWNKWLAFSTDDMVFYRNIKDDLLDLSHQLPKFNNQVFSFRLGENTIEQDIHRCTKQQPLNLHVKNGKYIEWAPYFYQPYTNYGYPLAIDLHVFDYKWINSLVNRFPFNSTNELEGKLQQFSSYIKIIRSFKESAAVNIPVNNLSGLTLAGQKHSYSPEWLNEQFLAGKVIDLESISKTKIVGCHQEIPLVLV